MRQTYVFALSSIHASGLHRELVVSSPYDEHAMNTIHASCWNIIVGDLSIFDVDTSKTSKKKKKKEKF